MILSTVPVLEDTHVICDWLELAVLCNEYEVYSFETLSRTWDTLRNSEDLDPEGSDSTAENFIDLVSSEIQKRSEVLDSTYPFKFSQSGESLEFDSSNVSDGGWIYVFCLILSHPSQGKIFDGKYLPEITHAVRNYFQACATFAAAGHITGHAYAFGFPRPDHSSFLNKLRSVYQHFGEGTIVVESIPPGAPASQKDAQIDIIAWEPARDKAAGKRYLLGQVASGANWGGKSIKGGPIDSFHQVWFSRCPPSTPVPSIFVPICYGSFIDGTNENSLNHSTYEFGHIFYRFRIPELAEKGLHLVSQNVNIVIERLEDLEHIKSWVIQQICLMKGTVDGAYTDLM
jgi:hypothetical protein